MEITVKTYVSTRLPGAHDAVSSAKEVEVRDPEGFARRAEEVVALFWFFDVAITHIKINGEHVELRSGPRNASVTYFIDPIQTQSPRQVMTRTGRIETFCPDTCTTVSAK